MFADRYGKEHRTAKEVERANACYELVEYLTSNLNMRLADAIILVDALAGVNQFRDLDLADRIKKVMP